VSNLSSFVGERLSYDPDGSLVTLFLRAVAERPDADALVTHDGTIGYRALSARIDAIVGALRGAGVRRGDLVGIALPRSIDLVAGVFAILACGAAYVPLDPTYPAGRIAAMVDDAEPAVVLVDASTAEAVARHAPTLLLDGSERSDGRPWEPVAGDELAYVIYTSGSTGTPKGVEVAMRSLVAFAAWAEAAFTAEERAGVFFGTSISFDVSVFELVAPLCTGGALVLGTDVLEARTHPARDRIRTICATASGLASLAEAEAIPAATLTILQAGEFLGGALAQRLLATTNATLYNLCGATEDTVYSVIHRVARGESGDPPIGLPIADRFAYVCDVETLALVPHGVAGELCYAGVGVARAYRGMPEKTAERFVANPHARGDDDRILYRSGDLARVNDDGLLVHLGRLDDQVKIRGYRIELGDVAAAYAAHPNVREVAIDARRAPAGDMRLVAYAVPRDGELDVAAVQTVVAETLPPWMVPATLVPMREFARTPAGKLDRARLPEPTWGSAAAYAATQTPTEAAIAAIWAEILGVPTVGRDDDFFALGGHSLAAARATARVEERFGLARMLGALFTDATLAGFAEAVDRERALERPYDPVVVVGEAMDDRAPFFYYHGHYNGNESYVRRALDDLPPGYGLVSIAPHDGVHEPLPATIEAMAAERFATLRAMQPRGPYRLGGFCNGGLVAYHLATMLADVGETVEALVLFSSSVFRERVPSVVGRLAPALHRRATNYAIAFERGAASRAAHREGPPSTELDAFYQRVIRAYRPPNYSGPMTVLWGEDSREDGFARADLGWHAVAPAARIVRVPGEHDTIRKHPHLLAKHLRTYGG
jgi:amino acid adenylation domain-containing protein